MSEAMSLTKALRERVSKTGESTADFMKTFKELGDQDKEDFARIFAAEGVEIAGRGPDGKVRAGALSAS